MTENQVLDEIRNLNSDISFSTTEEIYTIRAKSLNNFDEIFSIFASKNARILSMARSRGDTPRYQVQMIICTGDNSRIYLVELPYSNQLPSVNEHFQVSRMFEFEHNLQWDTRFNDATASVQALTIKNLNTEIQPLELITLPKSTKLRFMLALEDDIIRAASADVRFNYRKIEQLLIQTAGNRIPETIERICGLCCYSHQVAFVNTYEKAMQPDFNLPISISSVRMFVLELERIINNLLWVSMSMMELGNKSLLQDGMALRQEMQLILSILKPTSTQLIIPFQNHISFESGIRYKIQKIINGIATRLDDLHSNIIHDKLVMRLKGKGPLNRQTARYYGAVGPTARASGIRIDLREVKDDLNYRDLDYRFPDLDSFTGDLFSTIEYRILEIRNSIALLKEIIHLLPRNPVDEAPKRPHLHPGTYIRHIEAPAGPLSYILTIDDNSTISDLHISIPTIINFPSVMKRMIGSEIKYVPLILKGIEMGMDPLESVLIKNKSTGEIRHITNSDFRRRVQDAILYDHKVDVFK